MVHADGDRRSGVRFEAFGAFWGTLDAGDAVQVRNLTRHGALLQAQHPLAVESVQSLSLMLDGQAALADARVRHFEPSPGPTHPDCYLVGVEFISASSAFIEAVERLISHGASPTELT